jgi:hypothetical protein
MFEGLKKNGPSVGDAAALDHLRVRTGTGDVT